MSASRLPDDEVVRVGKKRLSRAAYERYLAGSRRWKRENPERANELCYRTCEVCGGRRRHNAEICRKCRQAATEWRDQVMLEMRAAGHLDPVIGAFLGISAHSVASRFRDLRKLGVTVPRSPYHARGQRAAA